MRIVVLGSRGQLGAAVAHEFASPAYEVIALDRAALDITDVERVASTMTRLAPDVVINCAGNNAVDRVEDHPIDAFLANAFAVRSLTRATRALDAVLVQYSSDFVFDGTADRPQHETDRPNPRSVYAMSKMMGEWFAADTPRAYVLRAESLFGAGSKVRRRGAAWPASFRAWVILEPHASVGFDRTASPITGATPCGPRASCWSCAPFGSEYTVNSGAHHISVAARLLAK